MKRYRDPEKAKVYYRKWYINHTEEQRIRVKKSRKEIADWFEEYKSTLRCECGENHPAAIDFHHLDPSVKEGEVSIGVRRRWSKQRILDEISKCKVMCSNCHRKLHWNKMHSHVT